MPGVFVMAMNCMEQLTRELFRVVRGTRLPWKIRCDHGMSLSWSICCVHRLYERTLSEKTSLYHALDGTDPCLECFACIPGIGWNDSLPVCPTLFMQ